MCLFEFFVQDKRLNLNKMMSNYMLEKNCLVFKSILALLNEKEAYGFSFSLEYFIMQNYLKYNNRHRKTFYKIGGF